MTAAASGQLWAGLHRAASESLIHATRDDDPRCVVGYANEAIQSSRDALERAINPRQKAVSERLLDAAHQIKLIAEHAGASGQRNVEF